jgi:DNA-binding CsgD family transcriptional regulator
VETAGAQPLGLLGRDREREALDRLLRCVGQGQSQVLVLRGEAGIGKTALLDYAVEHAPGWRMVRATGVQSELEFPFAGLHQLCGSMLEAAERLPGPQRAALRGAFGLEDGNAPDHFLIALAVLSSLADAAEAQPLACVVDDAQWLDRASRQVLSFVARRLLAERIALVLAIREPSDADEFDGLPELTVEGLSDDDARTVLASGIAGMMDARVRDRIVAETRGNPLALLELPLGLTPAELGGGFGLPDRSPLAGRIERSFLRRFEALPSHSRRLLLVAAAEPTGDVPLLWRAAERLGIGPGAAGPAEAAGLFELGAQVRFRHPLVRSAIYHAASRPECEEVHGALADATDADADPDRRAWHRAHAAAGLDEDVAGELERSADRAQGRGGVAAAAAFLERAAELTPEPRRRGARALAAAQAKLAAGDAEASEALLAAAELVPLDEFLQARLDLLRAQIAFGRTRGGESPALLLQVARRLEPLDAGMARETHLEAVEAAMFAGRLGNEPSLREVAEAVQAAPAAPRPPSAIDRLLEGLATRFTEGYTAAVPTLRRALDAFRDAEGPMMRDVRWLWLACRVAQDLWDDELWDVLSQRGLRVTRETGGLRMLPTAATYRAAYHVHAGAFGPAASLTDETDVIIRATGMAPVKYARMWLTAWRGDEVEAVASFESGRPRATARGEGRALGVLGCATALLHNGNGRYGEALTAARDACDYDDVGLFGWALAELIEAGVRSDATDAASAALDRLCERTQASRTEWALGVEAGSRALLADGDDAEPLYREAVERLRRSRGVVHVARAQLRYGEWLRRQQRRVDAREQLRAAHDTFGRIGALGFAERAHRELAATGEAVRRLTVETRDLLTPQEAQIAQRAVEGQSNPEIGAELFISPRTVEYHLHKVFTKLDIRSRKELRAALAQTEQIAVPA